MIIKEITIQKSREVYEKWISEDCVPTLNAPFDLNLDQEYLELRENVMKEYLMLKEENRKEYKLDYKFSLWFYDYMRKQNWLTPRVAANDDFWRYLAMFVMPDIISDRFPAIHPDHYYSRGVRIYPYILYWYSHLSWQDSLEETERLLEKELFSTRTINDLLDRPGKNGTFIDLYRKIVFQYGNTQYTNPVDYATLFSSIMKLCMAKTVVIDPDLCEGGTKEYARSLIDECINNVDFSEEEAEEQEELN